MPKRLHALLTPNTISNCFSDAVDALLGRGAHLGAELPVIHRHEYYRRQVLPRIDAA